MKDFNEFSSFVANAHGDQRDKSGAPYVDHLARTVRYAVELASTIEPALSPGEVEEIRWIAYGHDLFEDTSVDHRALLSAGAPERVAAGIEMLKRIPSLTYAEYIGTICDSDELSILVVKLADNCDNSDPRRAVPGMEGMAKRYSMARERLAAALDRVVSERALDRRPAPSAG